VDFSGLVGSNVGQHCRRSRTNGSAESNDTSTPVAHSAAVFTAAIRSVAASA
jgi:hypothetical protein